MGSGIAVAFLISGSRVTVVETASSQRDAVRERVADSLNRLARRNEDLDVDGCLSRLLVVGSIPLEAPALVVEAVPEDLELKRRLFASLEEQYGSDVILGSNTSSLSISEIAAGTANPERIVGLHFFNPVPVSSMVEIVRGQATSQDTVSTVLQTVESLGKEAIVVNDSPGFASSRLGVVLGLEAIRMLEAGVATVEDIDKAMELGYKHPMGPLRLTDLVGLDVRLAIARHLHGELGSRFEPPQLLVSMVDEGKIGKKAGQGFYSW